jgi:hypothetical protein
MCSLLFENNLLSREGVRFASISENTIIEAFLRFRFASIAITKLVSCLGRKNRASQPRLGKVSLKFNVFKA